MKPGERRARDIAIFFAIKSGKSREAVAEANGISADAVRVICRTLRLLYEEYPADVVEMLSIRAFNAIRHTMPGRGRECFADLQKIAAKDWSRVPNCGPQAVEEIHAWLLRRGVTPAQPKGGKIAEQYAHYLRVRGWTVEPPAEGAHA